MKPLDTLPIEICNPRCFVIAPKISRHQAVTKAGARAARTFGVRQLFARSDVNARLVERRLVPFWYIRCKSHFHYDRMNTYELTALDEDAVEITLHDVDDHRLIFPLNTENKVRVRGTERCVTDRDVSQLIDAYTVPTSASLSDKALAPFRDSEQELRQYLSHPSTPVDDLVTLYQEGTLDGAPLYDDLQGERVQVLLPEEPANRVVANVMKKVMVTIDPVAIHDWLLTVDTVDLYLRPLYIFQFERVGKSGDVAQRKAEQIDALSGHWTTLPTTEVPSPSVPWDRILLLTMDASAVVLQELGGPWLKVTGELLKVGKDHVPDIMKEMKKSHEEPQEPSA